MYYPLFQVHAKDFYYYANEYCIIGPKFWLNVWFFKKTKKTPDDSVLCIVRQVLVDFAVCDWGRYC